MKKILICLLVLCLAVVVGCSASPAAEVPATPVPDLNTDTVAPASEIEQETEENETVEEAEKATAENEIDLQDEDTSAQKDESNKEPVEIEVKTREYSATYIVLEDGTACIMKLKPEQDYSKAEFTIPAMLDHHIVSELYDGAIQKKSQLTGSSNIITYTFSKIFIPDSVVCVVGNPFSCDDSNYTPAYHVSVGDSHPTLAVIDDILYDKVEKAIIHFPYDKTINSFSVPEGILKIRKDAFRDASIEEIQFPNTLKIIEDGAFYGCPLSSIDIPDSVEMIGDKAFFSGRYYITFGTETDWEGHRSESNLTSVIMPDCINIIGNPFSRTNFTIKLKTNKEKEPTVTVDNGVLIDIKDNRIIGCFNKNISSYKIPDGIVSIDDYAFQECNKLKTITIPNSVTEIGENAFSTCDSLEKVILPGSLKTISNYSFSYCHKLKTVIISEGVETIGQNAFEYCENLKSISIPGSVIKIGACAFGHCQSIQEIVIPNGVEEIDSHAFSYCRKLKTVTLSESLKSINDNVFDLYYYYQSNQYRGEKNKNLNFIVVKNSYAHSFAESYGGTITYMQSLFTPTPCPDYSEIDWLKSDVTITPPPLEDRIPGPTNSPIPTSTPKSTPYVSFTNKYGTRTTICHHSGCNEYIATSGDTNCCPKHSRRCLECGAYIDEDANYCLSCIKKAFENAKKVIKKFIQ